MAKTFEVVINDSGFNPAALTINKGDTVRWVNKGKSPHSVVSGPVGLFGITNGNFDSSLLNPGVTFEHTFTLHGVANYYDASDTSNFNPPTGSIKVTDKHVIISPGTSLLHPEQRFDLVIFMNTDPSSSRILIIFDGTVIFDGDFFRLKDVTKTPFEFDILPVEAGGAIRIPIEPGTLTQGVHTLTVKVITESGDELSDTVVYTVTGIVNGATMP